MQATQPGRVAAESSDQIGRAPFVGYTAPIDVKAHPGEKCHSRPDGLYACAYQVRKTLVSTVTSDPARDLGLVDVHLSRMTVAARATKALKLSSVLQQRMAMPLYSFSLPKKFSIKCRHL